MAGPGRGWGISTVGPGRMGGGGGGAPCRWAAELGEPGEIRLGSGGWMDGGNRTCGQK